MNVIDAKRGQRSLSGNHYKICEVNNDIVIIEKSTKREVFRSCGDEFTGNLKVKDIEIFHEVLKQLNKEGFS